MQRLEVEDEIQLADILKQLIQRLDVYLYQVDQRERRLRRRRDDDEVERRIMAVRHQRRHVALLFRRSVRRAGRGEQWRERQEVAGTCRAIRHEGEDFGYQALLDAGVLFLAGNGFSKAALCILRRKSSRSRRNSPAGCKTWSAEAGPGH